MWPDRMHPTYIDNINDLAANPYENQKNKINVINSNLEVTTRIPSARLLISSHHTRGDNEYVSCVAGLAKSRAS